MNARSSEGSRSIGMQLRRRDDHEANIINKSTREHVLFIIITQLLFFLFYEEDDEKE